MFLFWKENCAMCDIWAKGAMFFIILSKDFVTLLPPPADSAAELLAVQGFRGYDIGLGTQTERVTQSVTVRAQALALTVVSDIVLLSCALHYSENEAEDSTFSWRTQSDRRQTDRKETSEYSMRYVEMWGGSILFLKLWWTPKMLRILLDMESFQGDKVRGRCWVIVGNARMTGVFIKEEN